MAKPIRKADIVGRDIGGETLLCGAGDEAVHILNPTAKTIWDLCDGQHTLHDMEQTIRTQFILSDDRRVCEDVERTLQTFAAKGLLQEQG